MLATQIAEATFVAKDGSPLKTLADLKGKKVGMSPVGSATYAIVSSVLERNYGLKPSDYTPVGGNEGQIVRLLERGDVDAASLRAVTIASVPELKLQTLGRLVDEWKKMTRANAVPILAVALVHTTFAKDHPDAVVKAVRAIMAATKFGHEQPDKAADMLSKTANLDAKDATSYARLWDQIYIATMEPQDVATFKTMAQIFKAIGTIEGDVPGQPLCDGALRAGEAPAVSMSLPARSGRATLVLQRCALALLLLAAWWLGSLATPVYVLPSPERVLRPHRAAHAQRRPALQSRWSRWCACSPASCSP